MTETPRPPPHRSDVAIAITSACAPVRRSSPPPKPHYGDYREELRWDFWYHCAYCTIAEGEAEGISFGADHYLPQARYPERRDAYENLFWCCETCNSFKGDAPSEPAARRGLRFLKVDTDDPADHLALSEDSGTRLVHRTKEVGEYTVEKLNLNRQPLRRLREVRLRLYESRQAILSGIRSLKGQNVQDLPRTARMKFAEIRSGLINRTEAAFGKVDDELIRAVGRSRYLDPPSGCDSDARGRREYLRQVNSPIAALAHE